MIEISKEVTCKICGKKILKEEAYCVSRMYLSKKGKDAGNFKTQKKYYCSKEEYENVEYEKMKEVCMWKELYNFVRIEVMKYSKNQSLPPLLISRIQDLRNGSVILPKVGKIKQSKEGYSYEVILETFKKHLQNINFWISKKQFKNEQQKINYIMAIINGNINDIYNSKKETEKRTEQNIINEENVLPTINFQETNIQKTSTKDKKQTLLDFLTDEDLS